MIPSQEELERIPEPIQCNYTGEMDWWVNSRQAKWLVFKNKVRDFFLRPKFINHTPEERELRKKLYRELKENECAGFNKTM